LSCYGNKRKKAKENDLFFYYLFKTLHIPVLERTKDEKITLEYYDEQINDRLILPILKISYRYFVVSNYNQIMIENIILFID